MMANTSVNVTDLEALRNAVSDVVMLGIALLFVYAIVEFVVSYIRFRFEMERFERLERLSQRILSEELVKELVRLAQEYLEIKGQEKRKAFYKVVFGSRTKMIMMIFAATMFTILIILYMSLG